MAFHQRIVELWCHAKNFPNDPHTNLQQWYCAYIQTDSSDIVHTYKLAAVILCIHTNWQQWYCMPACKIDDDNKLECTFSDHLSNLHLVHLFLLLFVMPQLITLPGLLTLQIHYKGSNHDNHHNTGWDSTNHDTQFCIQLFLYMYNNIL